MRLVALRHFETTVLAKLGTLRYKQIADTISRGRASIVWAKQAMLNALELELYIMTDYIIMKCTTRLTSTVINMLTFVFYTDTENST